MLNKIGKLLPNNCSERIYKRIYKFNSYGLSLCTVFRCSQTPAIFSAISAPSTWGHALTLVRSVGRRLPLRQASSSISTFTAVSNPLAVSQSFVNVAPFLLAFSKACCILNISLTQLTSRYIIYLPLSIRAVPSYLYCCSSEDCCCFRQTIITLDSPSLVLCEDKNVLISLFMMLISL